MTTTPDDIPMAGTLGGGVAPILLYATRYALGRRSGAAQDVETAIAVNLEALRRDAGCRHAIIRAIEEQGQLAGEDYGAPCDRESWMRTLGRLQAIEGK